MRAVLFLGLLAQIDVYNGGVYQGRARQSVDCYGGATCYVDGGADVKRLIITLDGGSGGSGVTDAKYIVGEAHAGLSAEVAPAGDDRVPLSSSATAASWVSVPDCDDSAGQHLNYDTSGNAFSCGATSSLPTPPVCESVGWDGGAFTCGNYDGGINERWHNFGESGEPAFESSWVNYDTTNYYKGGFRKVAGNRVELRGLIKDGTVDATCVNFIATMPVGYRPSKHTFAASVSNGGALVLFSARSGGGICVTTGSNAWLSLDNIGWSLDP